MAKLDVLLSTVRHFLNRTLDEGAFPDPMVKAGLAALDIPELGADFPELDPPSSCKWLLESLQWGAENDEPLSTALQPVWSCMRWVTNGNYEGRPEMANYLRKAAYCEIVGSRGLVVRKDVSIGFFYIGPDVTYPAHDHPSPEAYWVLSGHAEWWRDGAHWETRPPGSRIYHPPHVSHGMRTSREPLLTFFVWTGDVASLAKVTEAPAA